MENEELYNVKSPLSDTPIVQNTNIQEDIKQTASETTLSETAAGETTSSEANLEETASQDERNAANGKKKGRVIEWLKNHKPTKRRLIQVYAALLYNCYLKGFIKGEIFTGITKAVCVPGLNCYSCPGAIGACPLGSLQNALASTKTRAPYYVIGIILLYCIMFGRTVCGWLCPVGLAQDLLYKIKTPKIQKSGVSRVFSYLKYVILAILVIAIPLVYVLYDMAVPGFCKYICPAGTFGGAIMLLLNPSNDGMFGMLGSLFTWKMVVLVAVIAGCIFIYRMFCRFLCPLGALYGLFNKFALLGIKLDKSKCIDCGKCITTCKMDIKHVGDHECINCGECVGVCPTKAISWKGGKIFLTQNEGVKSTIDDVEIGEESAEKSTPVVSTLGDDGKFLSRDNMTKKSKKAVVVKVVATILAVCLFVGMVTYVNLFVGNKKTAETYTFVVSLADENKTGLVTFTLGDSTDAAVLDNTGSGTKEDPYLIKTIVGSYVIPINTKGQQVYFKYVTEEKTTLNLSCNADLHLCVYFRVSQKDYLVYDNSTFDGNVIKLDFEKPSGYGNTVGTNCYDFTLKGFNGVEEYTLSEHKGKIVVINFWATWCGGCVEELPDFEVVKEENENIEIIAIHSSVVTQAVQPFIDDKGWDKWEITFLQDTGTDTFSEIFNLLGGKNSYPRTLILDAEGVVRYVFEGNVSQENLRKAVNSLS